jgi:hypothetical protein
MRGAVIKLLLFYLLFIIFALYILLARPFRAEATLGGVRCGGTGLAVCLTNASPFVNQYLKPGVEWTYCINPRGLLYPGFRDQTTKVMQRWATDLRTTAREVPWPSNPASTACTVRNDMIDNHPCSECGAWVYTQAMPVLIEYNAKTGYSRWDSTLGHEFGHASCLLDEHYDEANFRSWILTYGYWQEGFPTVMDVGTFLLSAYSPLGIWFPTDYDLARCSETLGRAVGPLPPPPPPLQCLTAGYDPCSGRWYQPDGWSFDPATMAWHGPDGRREYGPCNADRLRWNELGAWFPPGSSFFVPSRGFWSVAPPC